MGSVHDVETFTLANTLRALAQSRPDHEALISGERRLSFADLAARSSRVANGLLEARVGPGERVGVLVKNTSEFYEVVFGASKVDAAVVALNWRLAEPELGAILADAEPSVLVVDSDFVKLLPARGSWAERVVTLGEEYEQWLAGASSEDPAVPSGPDSVMLILYSSGTTGLPKGVMLTNSNLSYIPRMARELFRMSPASVHLVASPLFHIGGAGTGMTTVTLGGRTVIVQDVKPAGILETIERERVTHAFFVPAVIQRLIESPEARELDLSSLELIAYGAAPMSETLLRSALETLGCGFVGCYGMTETAGTVVSLPPEDHVPDGPRARLLRSVGKTLPWHEVRVTNLATGEEASCGEVGEIWVRSGMNMKGYFKQPETTAQTLRQDGWLRTGDGAYQDEEGYFFLTDRLKDMIISGGENVYPAEVENVLAAHPAVAEAAVIGVPHEKWGETVMAIVVLRPQSQAGPQDLIKFTRERLAHYKCPTLVDVVDELPRNPSGKVVKKILREAYAGAAAPRAAQ
jgi:acyl-CoA synthetase (AMP-forming)/AMP-acid ligase II